MKQALRKFLLLIAFINTILLVFSLTSCFFDLGDDFNGGLVNDLTYEPSYDEMYDGYYDTFGDIILLDQDCNDKDYDLEDSFFNETTVNDLEWEDEDDSVPYKEYIYMAIEVKNDFYLSEFTLFFKRESESEPKDLTFNMFIVDELNFSSSEVCQYNEDPYDRDSNTGKPLKNTDGSYAVKDEFKDPNEIDAIATTTFTVEYSTWSSITVNGYIVNSENKSYVKVEEDQYILLRFKNNTGYGNVDKLQKIKFSVINLLIRSANDDEINE